MTLMHCEYSVDVCVGLFYLLVNLLCGLSIAEGHCGHFFEDGHLHSAVAPVQQGHQWARVHWPVQDGGSDT